MSFIPYLYFNGTCEAAFDFYADVFGATDVLKMRYADAPPDLDMPVNDKIMHITLSCGDWSLMGNDVMAGTTHQPQASVAIAHQCADLATAQSIFERLQDGGAVTMPFAETFFAPGFGMCTDQFGTHWMVMVDP